MTGLLEHKVFVTEQIPTVRTRSATRWQHTHVVADHLDIDPGVQARLVSAVTELLDQELAHGRLRSPMPSNSLAYLIVRIIESFVYSDIITGEQLDIAAVEQAITALVGEDVDRGWCTRQPCRACGASGRIPATAHLSGASP